MDNKIIKTKDELKELKKIYWMHYFNKCDTIEQDIKELEKNKKDITKQEPILLQSILFCGTLIILMYLNAWLWS